MRCLIAMFITALTLVAPASARPSRDIDLSTRESILKWIYGYRAKPDPAAVPEAVHALSRLGVFNDLETSGAYVGFIAGVVGSNPARAEALVARMFPLPPADQWVIVRAIAYSGLPEWKALLSKFAGRMPARKAMIDKYLAGKLPTLAEVIRAKDPTLMDKLRGYFNFGKRGKPPSAVTWALDGSPELLDTLWGHYFATGSYGSILRIIGMLAWSKDRDNVEKLTIGSMAKYTLTINAARDVELLTMLKAAVRQQPEEEAAVLKDVIDAADTADTARIRKEQIAAIEEIKRKGPGFKRKLSSWGQLSEGAIGVGCVTAAVMSVTALGIPCVVGGAATSAALHYWARQD